MKQIQFFPMFVFLVFIFTSWGCDLQFEGSVIHIDPSDIKQNETATSSEAIVGIETDSSTDADSTLDRDTATILDNDTATHYDTATEEIPTDSNSDTGSDSNSDDGTSSAPNPATDSDSDPDSDSIIIPPLGPDLGMFIDNSMWSFFSIADMQDDPTNGTNHVRSMYMHDPKAIALIEVGDLTHNATLKEWETHHLALETGAMDAGGPADHFRTTATGWGDYTRFVGVPGNHELWGSSDWLTYWNKFLPGQQHLGANSELGVYFTLDYENTLFIILDSNHYTEAQSHWLEAILNSQFAQNARWKLAFFHAPVYPCDSKTPQSNALPWVTLFEEHGVDLVVHGHAHTFERTCPMKNGKCVAPNEQGVTYLVASGGGTGYQRQVDIFDSGVLTHGDRTDSYECQDILMDYEDYWHHFCHYTVGDCKLIVRCYDHDYWAGGQLRHQFMIDKCE